MDTWVVGLMISTKRVNGDKKKFSFKIVSVQNKLFFKSVKFGKDLIQPIRDYINSIHEDYMKALFLTNRTRISQMEIKTVAHHSGIAQ